jgi:hypothetical protein
MRAAAAAVALLAIASVGLAAAQASGAGWQRPRPSDVPHESVHTSISPTAAKVFNDFATPEHRFESKRVVVHYVVVGIDAPAQNDDDGDGVPDYVERIGEAADTAIEYYERRGFRAIRPDTGGPDARPDVYVSRFTPGVFGISLPASRAVGGAFAVVSNALDPSAGVSFGSVYGTVAHEMFHLTQFSYAPATTDPLFPSWVLEGTAAAMESRVHPGLDDLVSRIQLREWLGATERSIAEQTYGAQRLWHYLDERHPALLPAYLARLERAGKRAGRGMRAFLETYGRVTGNPFGPEFHRFALAVEDSELDRLTPAGRLRARAARSGSIAPFAVHYLGLTPRRTGTYRVRVRLSAGAAIARASLACHVRSQVAGYPSLARRIPARVSDGGRTFVFSLPAALRRNPRLASTTLVLSNGGAEGRVSYSIAVR